MSSVLHFFDAVKSGRTVEVGSLLDADATLVYARDERNKATALHYAVEQRNKDLVRLLLEHQADVNARDGHWGATPKGWAVEYLLEHGAHLGIQIDDMLHAVRTEDVAWAQRFLARNPHLAHVADERGTALEQAKRTGNAELIALLEAHQ